MPQKDTFPFGQEIVWQPNPEWIAESSLQHFMNRHNISNFDDLLIRSVRDAGWF
jgi:acetyl-CoA synthetase